MGEAGTQDRDMVGSKDMVLSFGGHGAVDLSLFHPSGLEQAWVGTASRGSAVLVS